MPVLVTSKFDEDPIKNDQASLKTPFSNYKSMGNLLDAPGPDLQKVGPSMSVRCVVQLVFRSSRVRSSGLATYLSSRFGHDIISMAILSLQVQPLSVTGEIMGT